MVLWRKYKNCYHFCWASLQFNNLIVLYFIANLWPKQRCRITTCFISNPVRYDMITNKSSYNQRFRLAKYFWLWCLSRFSRLTSLNMRVFGTMFLSSKTYYGHWVYVESDGNRNNLYVMIIVERRRGFNTYQSPSFRILKTSRSNVFQRRWNNFSVYSKNKSIIRVRRKQNLHVRNRT